MKQTSKIFVMLFIAALVFTSCNNIVDPPPPLGVYEDGLFVCNEGPFMTGSGTLTYVSYDLSTVEQNVYKNVNGDEDLGNIVQSIGFEGDRAYIVVNNAHKLVVANRYTMEKEAVIEGLENPRFFVAISETRGYVSCWGNAFDATDDYIAVIDLTNNTVSSTIPVALGPEKMVVIGDAVYVAHQGAYGQNNIISVLQSDAIATTIAVADVPNSIVADNNGVIWVLCGGKPAWTGTETIASLYKINSATNTEVVHFDFPAGMHPSHLTMDKPVSEMYYALNGSVYKINTSASMLPSVAIFAGNYYNMAVHNRKLYATDAGNFASEGELNIIDLTNTTVRNTVTTGIIPGNINFN
jgi:hypothetical protein